MLSDHTSVQFRLERRRERCRQTLRLSQFSQSGQLCAPVIAFVRQVSLIHEHTTQQPLPLPTVACDRRTLSPALDRVNEDQCGWLSVPVLPLHAVDAGRLRLRQ